MSYTYSSGKPDASPSPAPRIFTTSITTQTTSQQSLESQASGYNLRSRQVEDAEIIAYYSNLSEFQTHVATPTYEHTVRYQICEPLGERDDETGWVYIYNRASTPGYVKIGWTARSVEARLIDWSKCGYTPNELFRAGGVPNAHRAETLTHYELMKEWRRERRCRVHTGISHQEWFEVSQERAIQVLGDWAEFFRKAKPYGEDGWLKGGWRSVVDDMVKKGEDVTSKKLLERYEESVKPTVKDEATIIPEVVNVELMSSKGKEREVVPREAPKQEKPSIVEEIQESFVKLCADWEELSKQYAQPTTGSPITSPTQRVDGVSSHLSSKEHFKVDSQVDGVPTLKIDLGTKTPGNVPSVFTTAGASARTEPLPSSGSLFSKQPSVKVEPLAKSEVPPRPDLQSNPSEPAKGDTPSLSGVTAKPSLAFHLKPASKTEPSVFGSALFDRPAQPLKESLFGSDSFTDYSLPKRNPFETNTTSFVKPFATAGVPKAPSPFESTAANPQVNPFKTDLPPKANPFSPIVPPPASTTPAFDTTAPFQTSSIFGSAKIDTPVTTEPLFGGRSFKADSLPERQSLFDTNASAQAKPLFNTGAQSSASSSLRTKPADKTDPSVTKESLFGTRLFKFDSLPKTTTLFGASPSTQSSASSLFATKAADKTNDTAVTAESLFGMPVSKTSTSTQSKSLFDTTRSSKSTPSSGATVQSSTLFSFETKTADNVRSPSKESSLFGTRSLSTDTLSQNKSLFGSSSSSTTTKSSCDTVAQSSALFGFKVKSSDTSNPPVDTTSLFGKQTPLTPNALPQTQPLFSESVPLRTSENSSSLFGHTSKRSLFETTTTPLKMDSASKNASLFSQSGSLFSKNEPIVKPGGPSKPLFDTSAFPKTQFAFQAVSSSTFKKLPKILALPASNASENNEAPNPQTDLIKPPTQMEVHVHEQERSPQEGDDNEVTIVEHEAEVAAASVVTYEEEGETLVNDSHEPLALKMEALEIVDKLVQVVACTTEVNETLEAEAQTKAESMGRAQDGVEVMKREGGVDAGTAVAVTA
ncbi:hypothetical protein N0V83_003368 [Neocucurbitaria cava]|uniref:Bacteriophage T5 Orf172 DNA-binding domain-containing protein n=1 Tax=Neocucurbitaria cava TaxID=798079 RepID=A0A9W8YBK7_9PLEO|nr:hypothetical protein N0V83_003368 [Neocucurbitaria cava]